MNICVCGYYGLGNFGDELFLKTFKQLFSKHNVFQWVPCLDANKIEAVIIGGGDLIQPYCFNEGYFPLQLAHIPTWLYGVGIVDYYNHATWPKEEIKKNRERINSAVNTVYRDDHSANIAKEFCFHKSIEVAPDIVFAYQEPCYPIGKLSSKKTIGICIYVYDDFPYQMMLLILKHLVMKDYHLVFIPVVNKNNLYSDMDMCETLYKTVIECMPNSEANLLWHQFDIEMTYSMIQSLDYLISFKLHPVIAAMRAGVPSFSFSKLSKVRNLHKAIHSDYYISDYDMPLEDIKQRIDAFLQDSKRLYIKEKIAIEQMQRKSMDRIIQLKEEIQSHVIGQ